MATLIPSRKRKGDRLLSPEEFRQSQVIIMEKKSPLKESLLRLPGQSLQDEINDLIDDKLTSYLLLPLMFFMMAMMEWIGYFYKAPRQPIVYTVFAIALSGYSFFRILPIRRKLKQLKQARDGERAIGQFLEEMRRDGYQVFHDLVGDGFNVDHVIVGPKGVFTIETKTISKPVKGRPSIQYDGESIRIMGYTPDRDPILQAKAQASWLKNLLAEQTGKKVAVQPVVVYPGWYVESPPKGKKSEVWVLNHKALPSFIANHTESLEETDVHLFKSRLSQFIRK